MQVRTSGPHPMSTNRIQESFYKVSKKWKISVHQWCVYLVSAQGTNGTHSSTLFGTCLIPGYGETFTNELLAEADVNQNKMNNIQK